MSSFEVTFSFCHPLLRTRPIQCRRIEGSPTSYSHLLFYAGSAAMACSLSALPFHLLALTSPARQVKLPFCKPSWILWDSDGADLIGVDTERPYTMRLDASLGRAANRSSLDGGKS